MSYPPKGSLLSFPYTQGQGGVPVFASQDASGTVCIPTANYTNTEGVWAPAPTTSEGIPQVGLTGSLAPLPSPGEKLLVGPSAGISIPPGASYSTPTFNAIGNRMVGYFMDASLSSTATLSSTLVALSSLLANNQNMYIVGASQETYNSNSWTNSSAIMTAKYAVTFNAASGNTTDATLNGVSVGIG